MLGNIIDLKLRTLNCCLSSSYQKMTSLLSQPKDYFDLVKSIGEAKSKQEEDRIVAEEVSCLTRSQSFVPSFAHTSQP